MSEWPTSNNAAFMRQYLSKALRRAIVAVLLAAPLSAQIVQGVLVDEKSQQLIHNARVPVIVTVLPVPRETQIERGRP
jgi:hypothetical protein